MRAYKWGSVCVCVCVGGGGGGGGGGGVHISLEDQESKHNYFVKFMGGLKGVIGSLGAQLN